jgi:hypothetical protein
MDTQKLIKIYTLRNKLDIPGKELPDEHTITNQSTKIND